MTILIILQKKDKKVESWCQYHRYHIRTRHRIQIFTQFFCVISMSPIISTLLWYNSIYILVTWDQSGSTLWYDDIRICWHLQHSYELLFAAVSTTGPGKCWNFKRNIVTDCLILDSFFKLRWTGSSYKGDRPVQQFLAYDQDLLNGPASIKIRVGYNHFSVLHIIWIMRMGWLFSKGAVSYNSFCFANNYKNGPASCKEDGHLQQFLARDP